MLKLIMSVVVLVAGTGGAALLRAPAPKSPAHVEAVQLAATSAPDLQGAITGVVTGTQPGEVTLEVSPAALPSGIAATTTGGQRVDAVLPLASGVKIYGTLTVGAHVAVVLSNGSVTTVAVLPGSAPPGAVKPLPARAAAKAASKAAPASPAVHRDPAHPQSGRHPGHRGR